ASSVVIGVLLPDQSLLYLNSNRSAETCNCCTMARFANSLLVLAFAFHSFVAAIDCNGTITITSQDDAKDVRKCKVVGGDLKFAWNLSESIDLDGLEGVNGSVKLTTCDDKCDDITIPPPFNISSPTLKRINGSLSFSSFYGLEKLILPNLNNVNQSVSLLDLDNATHIDLTRLATVGGFALGAKRLEELKLDGLRNLTDSSTGNITVYDVGTIQSVDGIYENPIEGLQLGEANVTLNRNYTGSVKNVTFGWTRVHDLLVESGAGISVTLGGPSSESVEIDYLKLGKGVVGLERGSQMKNLTVKKFQSDSMNITSLKLDFDQASEIAIVGTSLKSVEIPSEAENWKNLNLTISTVPLFEFGSKSADGSQAWHWPKGDMSALRLVGNMTADFLTSFVQGSTRVVNTFHIDDTSGSVNCTALDQIKDRLPEKFFCQARNDNGASMPAILRPLHIGVFLSTVIVLAL
ncbi:unnamed protein product, partial [Clonostachys byssicola]